MKRYLKILTEYLWDYVHFLQGISFKFYDELWLMEYWLYFAKLYSEIRFFYKVAERRKFEGSYPTLEDGALESTNNNGMNKHNDSIISIFWVLTMC